MLKFFGVSVAFAIVSAAAPCVIGSFLNWAEQCMDLCHLLNCLELGLVSPEERPKRPGPNDVHVLLQQQREEMGAMGEWVHGKVAVAE